MRTKLPCVVLFALGLATGRPMSAAAPASLSLEEVRDAIRSEPDLVRQIEVELRRRDLKPAGIVCSAALHGDQWRLLGGRAAAPYQCTIGDRTLRVDADRTYFDAQGHKLGQVGKVPYGLLFQRAKFFREGGFHWTWTP
jgi:hypothetical protein